MCIDIDDTIYMKANGEMKINIVVGYAHETTI